MEEKINKKNLFYLLGFLTIFILSFILINEYTIVFGEEIYLKTIPVDPRDLLRGDYVVLDYEIQENKIVSDFIKKKNLSDNDKIYLILKKDENNFADLKDVSLTEPENELFIKGRIKKDPELNRIDVDLGIGKYFIPEGRGLEIERLRGEIYSKIKVDNFGNAKIVGLYYDNKRII